MADVDLYKVLLVRRSLLSIVMFKKYIGLRFSQAANNYTYDEIQIGLANCPDGGDPVMWLNDNWQKLIETVQTLATKYGQEHKENIVGTISTRESRESLKKHKGNVWQAVTECIEQRRQAFNAVRAQGNFSREDIVTYLTQYQGNVDLTLNELNRLQLKPFLLKILGSPSGAENQSAAELIEPNSLADGSGGTNTGTISRGDEDKSDILRDIEAIIGNMEEKQSKQTETILQTIESLVGNMIMASATQNSQPISSSASSFSTASYERIDVKSPLQLPKQQMQQANGVSDTVNMENEVKRFVTSHIQDIVPDIAAMVNKELNESDDLTVVATNGVYDYVENDDDDDTGEYEDAIIELVLENPPEIDVHIDELTSDIFESGTAEESPPVTVEELILVNAVESPFMPAEEILPETIEESLPVAVNESIQNVEVIQMVTVPDESVSVHQSEDSESNMVKRSSSIKRPKFAVNKAFQRSSLRQSDRRRIRELERQLKVQQQRTLDSQMSGYLSDSTVVADENGMNDEESQSAEIIDAEERIFSFSITEIEPVETEQTDIRFSPDSVANPQPIEHRDIPDEQFGEGSSAELTANDAKNRNLSEIVQDTKELIRKMKNEIDEDIAMSVSEFDGDDSLSYENESDYSDEFDEEEQESIEFDENELDDSDGWTDVDDDEIDEDEEELIEDEERSKDGEHTNRDNHEQYVRSSQSIESERFVEAQEEIALSSDETQAQSVLTDNYYTQTESDNPEEAIHNGFSEAAPITPVEGEQSSVEGATENIGEEPLPIDSADYLENIISIQRSLQSSLISLNIREAHNTGNESTHPGDTTSVTDNADTSPDTYTKTNITETPSDDSVETGTNEIMHSESSHSLAESTSEVSEAEGNSTGELLSLDHEAHTTVDSEMNVDDISETAIDDAIESTPRVEMLIDEVHEQQPKEPTVHTSTVGPFDHESTFDDKTSTQDPSSNDSPVHTDFNEPSIDDKASTSQAVLNESLIETFKYSKITVPVITPCSQSSINVMQLKKTDSNRNKIPVRRSSFTEPSAGIRNLQNELFNRQSKPVVKPVAKKPSKIVPPKLFFKDSAPLTKVNNKSHSGAHSIPKKKYYETCFSDDYQTSDDEKPICSSKKVIPNLVKIVETRGDDVAVDPDVIARRIMEDGLLDNYLDAALAAELIQMKFDEKTAIAAAIECNSLEHAIAFLRQECELCTETYPMNKIVSMLKCQHSCCVDCARNYFTIQVSDAHESCCDVRDLRFFFFIFSRRLPIAVLPIARARFASYPI